MPGFMSDSPLARDLIRIGDQAIAREDDAALRAYFAEDYVFHGPGGDLGFDQLSGYFASLRAAFTDLRLVREQIIVDGNFLAARTTFSGDFTGVYLLADRSRRAHQATHGMGGDRYLQVRRRRSAGRGMGADRLPQLFDQARCDGDGDCRESVERPGAADSLPTFGAGRAPTVPLLRDVVGYQDSVVADRASIAASSPSISTRACPWRPKA